MKYGNALLWTAKARVCKNGNFTSFQFIYGSFFVYRHNISPRFHPLSLPAVFADFLAAFLKEHESILRNTIVYGDITIYRNNVKTLRFLKNVHSASAMRFAA